MVVVYGYTAKQMDVQNIPYADLGDTRVVHGGSRGLLIVLADTASADAAVEQAKWFALSGRTVGVVNVDVLLANAKKQSADCLNHVTLLDVYAQFLQQNFEFSVFDRPSMVGVGRGSRYLKILLAQAPAGIFAAGISLNDVAPLHLPAVPCGAMAAQMHWVSSTQTINTENLAVTATPWTDFSAGWSQSISVLWQLVRTQFFSASVDDGKLPLIEMPQPDGGAGNYFVVMLSGDGGWANIDKDIAEDLGGQQVAVVGWNSLRYFWQAKSPDVMANDLSTVIKRYQQQWKKSHVLLAGFSLGADVLPFMVSRLPVDVQKQVVGIVLLSPSKSADFQFHVSDWLGSDEGSPNALLPELEKIHTLPLLCMYGEEESDDTVCTDVQTGRGAKVVQLPGDHHFDGDNAAVTKWMLSQFPVQR
jgi:type IV secretory pathway VirJ component